MFACYTAYLATGATILAIAIKVDTIKRYLFAAIKLSYDKGQVNPTLTKSGHKAACVQDILTEARRWEKVPNRCEPITPEMVDYVLGRA